MFHYFFSFWCFSSVGFGDEGEEEEEPVEQPAADEEEEEDDNDFDDIDRNGVRI